MRLFIDSTSLSKRYILEEGSEDVDHVLGRASELGMCITLVPEIISALNLRKQEGLLTETDCREIKRQLLEDVHESVLILITPAVIARSLRLQEADHLKTMDAVNIACALDWRADLFVTSDKRQLNCADLAGLKTKLIS